MVLGVCDTDPKAHVEENILRRGDAAVGCELFKNAQLCPLHEVTVLLLCGALCCGSMLHSAAAIYCTLYLVLYFAAGLQRLDVSSFE